jgi:hypothetical protein
MYLNSQARHKGIEELRVAAGLHNGYADALARHLIASLPEKQIGTPQ